jgi:hypothetical protein
MMEKQQQNEPAKQRIVFSGFMLFLAVSIASLLVLQLGSGIYKQWGEAIFMGLIGSLIVFRCLQEFIGNRVYGVVPYILPTFWAVTFVAIFASPQASLIAWIVYWTLAVIAGFYWVLHIIVDAVKTFPRFK